MAITCGRAQLDQRKCTDILISIYTISSRVFCRKLRSLCRAISTYFEKDIFFEMFMPAGRKNTHIFTKEIVENIIHIYLKHLR